MTEYTPTTEDIALGYALHEAREAGITDPSERLIFVAGLYTTRRSSGSNGGQS